MIFKSASLHCLIQFNFWTIIAHFKFGTTKNNWFILQLIEVLFLNDVLIAAAVAVLHYLSFYYT